MRENAIIWIIGLTIFIALGLAGVIAYEYIKEIIEAYFLF